MAKAKANNIPSSRLSQFRPAGQAMLGVNNVVARQMPHFPQPRQHLPHSGQALHVSQAAPKAYQPARPESSASLLSQQQSVFPIGYFPTTGVPMPPPSYTYQPSSVPLPVVQPPDTALDQSLPLVTSQMQPWHQPSSSVALLPSDNSTEPSSSDWQVHTCTNGKRYYHNKKTRQSSWGKPFELMTPLEVTQFANAKVKSAESSSSNWQENTSSDGKKYYYNKKTRQSSWEKPAELMKPVERADASTEWIGFSTLEGRKYYYNRVTKESTWTIPDELKIAREFAEKVLNQLPDRETETTAGAAVCVEPSSMPANQSSSIVDVTSLRTHNAEANSVRPGGSLSHHVDKNSSSSDFGIQNDIPSISTVAPPITSTEVPSVESDSGTSRTNNENSTSHTDTQDGASAEDLQETEKTIPVPGKVHPIPLEEKTSKELVVYFNKLDARNAFRSLLESVESNWTWEQALKVIISDERYGALETLEDSLQAFNEYFNQREKLEPDKRCVRQKACEDFVTMLEECDKLTAKTRLSEAITMLEDDERFNAVEHPREREALVENYLAELQKKERAKASEEHKRHIADYSVLLESCDFIKASTRWRKVQDRLEDDERCSRLEIIDRLDIFEEYIQDLEKEEEKQKQLQQQQARRQERKKRDDFRRMLEEHVADGILTAKTRWLPYCDQVKSSHTYLGVASNTSGSTPKDLFEDVMEDLEEQYEADKSQIKEAVESGKLPMMASWTFEDFQTAVMAIGTFKGISDINRKLIYAKLIVRLREKELNEAKKRERLGDRFSDLLYSIMEISASSTWDNSKALFEDSQEYRDLNSETYARELFEKRLFHLKERLKEKERLREEEKAKKAKEREEEERIRRERKKETMKEKERKEKERKEREREKERERDKGKDWSRREGVHFDGAAANTHGSKDKKSDKDKEIKHKRCHHDTGDDVMSERGDSNNSQRHSSDRKKSRKDIMLGDPIVIGAKDLQGLRVFPQKLCT